MHPIQMVDLGRQHDRIKPEIDEAIDKVIKDSAFIKGKEVSAFEEDLANYLDVKQVIGCGNGTDALQIAVMALELSPEDEVLVPAFCYVAAAEVLALLNIQPVFVDVDPNTFNIDPESARKAITSKTKAIMAVHLFGQCAHLEPLLELAKAHRLWVIEDAAQSCGTTYRFQDGHTSQSGTIGHIGTTSFFPSKTLGCMGDGGALFTNDDQLANKIRMIANHGQKIKYQHEIIGINSRLDTIQAAILRIKLQYLNEYIERRQSVAAFYTNAFRDHPHITTPVTTNYSTHTFHQYTLKLSAIDRLKLTSALKELGIPTMIYYPTPLHRQTAYANSRNMGHYPHSEALSSCVLSLPIHTEMDQEQLEHITKHILSLTVK